MKVIRRRNKVILLNELYEEACWEFKSIQAAERAKKEISKQDLEKIYEKIEQRREERGYVPPNHPAVLSNYEKLKRWKNLREIKRNHPEMFGDLDFIEEESCPNSIHFWVGIENKGHNIKFFWGD